MSLLALAKLSRFVAALFDECTNEAEAEAVLQTLPEDKQHLINKLKLFYVETPFKLIKFAEKFTYYESEFLDSQVIDIYRKLTQVAHYFEDIIQHIAEDKRPRFEMLDYMFERGFFNHATIHLFLNTFIRQCIKYENLAVLEKLNDKYGVSNIYDYYTEVEPNRYRKHLTFYDQIYTSSDLTSPNILLGSIIANNNCSIETIQYCLANIRGCYIYAFMCNIMRGSNVNHIKFMLDNIDNLEERQQNQIIELETHSDNYIIGMYEIITFLIRNFSHIPVYVKAGFDIHKYANRIMLHNRRRKSLEDTIICLPKKLMDILAQYNITYDKANLISNTEIQLEDVIIMIE